MKHLLRAGFVLIALGGAHVLGDEAVAVSDHFDGKVFHNLIKGKEKSLMDVLRWRWTRTPPEEAAIDTKMVPHVPKARNEANDVAITFVGHSTFLLQANGMNILTDPIWSERCSPVSFIGPKRLKDPGIRFDDLPKIDVVVISHNHYDHLDVPTLVKLWQRDRSVFVVPLKNRGTLTDAGIAHVVELDWWASSKFQQDVTVTAVPAQHWSGRWIIDRNKALWAGYVVSFGKKNVYFAGDTGFSPHFEAIKKRFGDFELALIPIGAFMPRWFMRENHLSPEDAVQVAGILQARVNIPMHFGTFALGDDGYKIAENELRTFATDVKFTFLDVGESHQVSTVVQDSKP